MHYNGAEPKCFHHRVTYFYLVFHFSEFTPIIYLLSVSTSLPFKLRLMEETTCPQPQTQTM